MESESTQKRVVVIGGGTGSHTVLKGLKQYQDTLSITAVVSMADSGGSTGRLRDEFGYLPVGDIRMALTALAQADSDHEQLIRELFLHRFDRGDGLAGHNVGNLLLIALTDILGSEAAAIKSAAKLLRVVGTVIPVTADHVHLVATYDDGVEVVGESAIDEPAPDRHDHSIATLEARPVGTISDGAAEAIGVADLVIVGPGDLYSSLLANFVVGGVAEAVKESQAKLAFITSLMERPGQTRGLTQADTVNRMCEYIGRCPDVILVNDAPIPAEVIKRYQAEGNRPLVDDTDTLAMPVKLLDLLAAESIPQASGDVLKRSLVRHDSDKLAAALVALLQ